MQDLKFALRAFVRAPGASGLIVMTLAVAIAAATIIASTIDMVWRFIPAVRTDRLVFVASTDPKLEQSPQGVADGVARTGVSIPDLVDLTARTSTFEAFAGFTFQSAVLTGLDAPSRISTVRTTQNLLQVWGVQPQMGRTFSADEATAGRERVAILSHAFWQNQLAGASDAIGRTLTIDGHPHAIVGVLPSATATGMFTDIDVMLPIVLDRERAQRDDRRLYVTGVLKPGVPREQAEADLFAAARQLQTDYPRTNARIGAVVRPLIEMLGTNITAVGTAALARRGDGGLHRVRERIEHHPRACRHATSRAGRPRGTRGGPPPSDPPVHDREPRHVGGRGRRRGVSRLVGPRCGSIRQCGSRRLPRYEPERARPRR